MKMFSTTQAAKMLGITPMTLSRYIRAGKVSPPKIFAVGDTSLHGWTEEEIENLRQHLPKIANGRKTRYKKQTALSSQQSAKPKSKTKSKKKK
jgi:predicted transcriptional regulator